MILYKNYAQAVPKITYQQIKNGALSQFQAQILKDPTKDKGWSNTIIRYHNKSHDFIVKSSNKEGYFRDEYYTYQIARALGANYAPLYPVYVDDNAQEKIHCLIAPYIKGKTIDKADKTTKIEALKQQMAATLILEISDHVHGKNFIDNGKDIIAIDPAFGVIHHNQSRPLITKLVLPHTLEALDNYYQRDYYSVFKGVVKDWPYAAILKKAEYHKQQFGQNKASLIKNYPMKLATQSLMMKDYVGWVGLKTALMGRSPT